MNASYVEDLNKFAVSLFSSVTKSSAPGGNVFLSPFSVSTALATLMTGARSNTRSQIFESLSKRRNISSTEEEDYSRLHEEFKSLMIALEGAKSAGCESQVSLLISNMILVHNNMKLLDTFKADVANIYHANVRDVDFVSEGAEVVKVTNDWVNKSTKGLITKFLESPPSSSTRLLLLNAIYFKGMWKTPFKKELSKETFFTEWDGSQAKVTMMRVTKPMSFMYARGNLNGVDVHVVDVPYDEDNVFTIVLAVERNGLKKALEKSEKEKDMNEALKDIITISKSSFQKIDLSLPRFKMEMDLSLEAVLASHGMTDMFAGGACDFSGINGGRDLYVSSVKHKAVVEVNEEGTEAAAVTGVMLSFTSLPPPPIEVMADHSFLFFIRGQVRAEKTKIMEDCDRLVLFSGLFAQVPK